MSDDPFGSPVTLPSFPDPDSFRRNVVPGFIPSPSLITERVSGADLKRGDIVLLFAETILRTVDHVGPEKVRMSPIDSPDSNSPMFATVGMPIDRVTAITFGLLTQAIPVEWIRDDRYSGLGKFDSQYAEYCWSSAMDGATDTAGNCGDMGWHASLVNIHQTSNGVFPGRTDPVLLQWREEIGTPAGYIVHEDDRGFVAVEFFESVSELDQTWDGILTAESVAYDEEETETEADPESGCRTHGIIGCTAPGCDPLGVLHSEHVQNEIWGGTE